ncbi:MAG TPA: thiolase domain-containing protein [Methanomicrobia archaeon]|nr:thiolase domain-containing protein [Methanomicrobia archaeon]
MKTVKKLKPLAAVVGAGRTKFGELWYKNPEELLTEAGIRAVESVEHGLRRRDIQACYFGSFLYQVTNKLALVPGYMSRELGLNIPMSNTEAACGSGGSALYNACLGVRSGAFEVALVGGFEKMTDRSDKIIDDLMFAADPHEFDAGFTFAGLYATMMTRYIHDFGDGRGSSGGNGNGKGSSNGKCREALALVACKNHHHAVGNEYAQFRKEISVEAVLGSPLVADPIRMLHCSPVSDGAVALVVVRPEVAKNYTDTPVYIVGSQQATDDVSICSRESLTGVKATRLATQKVLAETGLTMADIQVAEVHDCFTIEEIFFLEDSGFCERGEGWKVVYESCASSSSSSSSFKGLRHIPYRNAGNNELVVNAGGGLKADGHPVGATGVRQAYECFKQLRGEAGGNQVEVEEGGGGGLNTALCHNIGGTGGIATVHILVRELEVRGKNF